MKNCLPAWNFKIELKFWEMWNVGIMQVSDNSWFMNFLNLIPSKLKTDNHKALYNGRPSHKKGPNRKAAISAKCPFASSSFWCHSFLIDIIFRRDWCNCRKCKRVDLWNKPKNDNLLSWTMVLFILFRLLVSKMGILILNILMIHFNSTSRIQDQILKSFILWKGSTIFMLNFIGIFSRFYFWCEDDADNVNDRSKVKTILWEPKFMAFGLDGQKHQEAGRRNQAFSSLLSIWSSNARRLRTASNNV